MRLSTLAHDPGYRDDHAEFVVMLDGEPQSPELTGRAIVTADEAAGAIWYYPCAHDGGLLEWGGFADPSVEMVEGKVSVYRIRSEYLPRRG